jgi:hypothetical protein
MITLRPACGRAGAEYAEVPQRYPHFRAPVSDRAIEISRPPATGSSLCYRGATLGCGTGSGRGGIALYIVGVPGQVTLEAVFEVTGGLELVVFAGVDD